ncbi:MAG TPA: hypothetical protein VMW58_00400 [Anaerolineae bacterium]|nr:hypothetical protein [Anaerolineae bacterium]
MELESPPVEFRLFSFRNRDATRLLPPEGTIVFQYLGFPRDFEDCTCIPRGPVGIWSQAGVTALDAQWYRRTEKITRADIPQDLTGSPRVKDHICHALRPDPNSYPLSALYVDGSEVQLVAFVGKRLLYRRLGHSVELDLQEIPDDLRFTLSIEWSYQHIEARVTWLEGEGLERYFSGRGVPYEDLGTYQPPHVGNVIQFKSRKDFETVLLPARVARAIWRQSKEAITDTNPAGEPPHEVGAPRKVYKDGDDFLQTTLNVFSLIQRILRRTKPHAFWDATSPKSEPHSGTSLGLLLEPICAYKNIRLYQEDPSRSGDVDFVFSGISMDLDHLQLILEIKNAHSGRLERGLTHQLPKYMSEREADYGVYGILWYKGRTFDEPADVTAEDCLARLRNMKPDQVHEVVAFDVSFPVQASKL